jgi:hypothetical protein
MRSIQDLYLRILHDLLEDGNARFLSLLLHPNYAFYDHTFENLDTSTFLYSAVSTKLVKTPLRESLARRSVRIAFEELRKYSSKSITDRKLQRFVQTNYLELTERIKKESKNLPVGTADEQWNKAVEESETIEERERIIGGLITQTQIYSDSDRRFKRCLETEFTNLAKELSEII